MKTEAAYLENKIEELEGRLAGLREKLNRPEKWEPPLAGEWWVSSEGEAYRSDLGQKDSFHLAYPDEPTATRIAAHLRKRDRLTRRMVELDAEAGAFVEGEKNWKPLLVGGGWEPIKALGRCPFATFTRSEADCRQVCDELNSGYLEL